MTYLDASATISPCGAYRYDLRRVWDADLPAVTWVLLNPSTADATTPDNTTDKCVRFARSWGYGGMVVVNLFAFRARDPDVMAKAEDPVGPDNDAAILAHAVAAANGGAPVICGWGAEVAAAKRPVIRERPDRVLRLLRGVGVEPRCLRLTKGGQPGHPLYLSGKLTPVPWVRKAVAT